MQFIHEGHKPWGMDGRPKQVEAVGAVDGGRSQSRPHGRPSHHLLQKIKDKNKNNNKNNEERSQQIPSHHLLQSPKHVLWKGKH